jgi:hypothetical protein
VVINLDLKTKLVNNLRSATSDKESMNRQILKLRKSFKEAEKVLNRSKGK